MLPGENISFWDMQIYAVLLYIIVPPSFFRWGIDFQKIAASCKGGGGGGWVISFCMRGGGGNDKNLEKNFAWGHD